MKPHASVAGEIHSTYAELVQRASQVLEPAVLDFILAGAGDERSLIRDSEAWGELPLRPRVLADVTESTTDIELLGTRLAIPVGVAPTGGHGLVHAEAEVATARGAAESGALFILSAYSNATLEEVAVAAPESARWFQLPHEVSFPAMEDLVRRAAAADYTALVLTLDQIVMGDSPVGARAAEALPTALVFGNLPGRPAFVTGYHPSRGTLTPVRQSAGALRELVGLSPLPVVVKGLLRGDDALRCVDHGAAAVIVSNHGARHLDGTVSPARALAEVVTAVSGRVPVLVDGGVRRGEHALRALALGAEAVLIGRAPLLGLAVAGSKGVSTVLEELTTQLRRAMALCGVSTMKSIDSDLLGAP